MDSSAFSSLNKLFLKAIEEHNEPDCLLYKPEGQYRGESSQGAEGAHIIAP